VSPPAEQRQALLRALPPVDEVLNDPALAPTFALHPRALRKRAVQDGVARARARILAEGGPGFSPEDVQAALETLTRPRLRRVLNATGTVLHTNLGRAPLAPEALARVQEIGQGYCNLEYDLDEGTRGSRYAPVVALLRELTGAEDALVVNNCAAATLLVLTALGQWREAVVSRGELVEIGGGFRVPDVMRQSGCALVEVGTTNRTRAADYDAACTGRTALLVKVHRSNFAIVGFSQEASVGELAEVGRRRGIPVFHDLGSGNLEPLAAEGLSAEQTVRDSVLAGADVVAFSGDKLLGGPQSGIVVGRAEHIARIREHPLNRALRVDKLTVAALEATLALYRDGRADEVPARALLLQDEEALERRALRLQEALGRAGVEGARCLAVEGLVGGGTLPLARPVSWACTVPSATPEDWQERLRRQPLPVVVRVADGQVLLDVRCLSDGDLEEVAAALARTRDVHVSR
jgi:L-seryl-tRNA(Ser) seleniumtransferase